MLSLQIVLIRYADLDLITAIKKLKTVNCDN